MVDWKSDGFSHLVGMNERKAALWLQELTDDLCWGIKVIDRKTGKPHPAYANTNKKLERAAARRFVILQLLTDKRLLAHFRSEQTLYFTGSPGGQLYCWLMSIATTREAWKVPSSLPSTFGKSLLFRPVLRAEYQRERPPRLPRCRQVRRQGTQQGSKEP